MGTAILIGALQGALEWLPVSSEGLTTIAYNFLLTGTHPAEAIYFALWIHLGTACSAIIAFRKDIVRLLKESLSDPRHPSRLASFLVAASVSSAVSGIPLLLALDHVTKNFGITAMGIVGIAMIVTGIIQCQRKVRGDRDISMYGLKDAVIVGLAQGLTIIPGLSRSGLTISILLVQQFNHRLALQLSFLLSIPASIGVAIFVSFKSDILASPDAFVAGITAFCVGLATIRFLLAVVERVNLGVLVTCIGVLIAVSSIFQRIL